MEILTILLLTLAFQTQAIFDSYDPMAVMELDKLSLVTRYTGMGYNILMANPEGDYKRGGVDPGIKLTRFIFKHTYNDEKEVFYRGKVVQVPDQVAFHMSQSCASKESSSAYSGETSYKKELSVNVEASASYEGLFSASFSLSAGMEEAKQKTENSKKVVVQKTKICNYGQARYKLANATPGYDLTDDFKSAIRLLPSQYSAREYTQFLDSWGTHILETVSVGTREISRSEATYNQVYKFLRQQNNVGVSVGGGFGGASGSVSLDINKLDESVNSNTNIGNSLTHFTIGTVDVPLPIHFKLISIDQALTETFWDTNERSVTRQKRAHVTKALTDYATNKQAHISPDPRMTITVQWPDGKYSLPQTTAGCPTGWSSAWRYQDNEDENNGNRWNPPSLTQYIRFDVGSDFRSYYCTKTFEGTGGFAWPRGRYCIARRGGSCPSGFLQGQVKWDDEDSRNKNDLRNPLPDGTYNHDTVIQYCCRSDGSANDRILLPTSMPFVLYRYDGTCQKIRGMNDPLELFVRFDDEDKNNANQCSGNYPDGNCKGDRTMYMCYYTPASQI